MVFRVAGCADFPQPQLIKTELQQQLRSLSRIPGSLLTPGVAIWTPTLGYFDRKIERMTLGLRPRAAIASIVVMTQ